MLQFLHIAHDACKKQMMRDPLKCKGGGTHLADVAHLGNIAHDVAHFWAHGLAQLLLREHAALQRIVQQSCCHAVVTGLQICQDPGNLSTADLQQFQQVSYQWLSNGPGCSRLSK